MTYRRGDLALVPFPFTDLSSAKRRPVLEFVDPDGYGDFLAVAVTSRPHNSDAIAIRDQDISSDALPATSWVRTDRVITFNAVLMSKVFGSASSMFVDQVIRGVCLRVRINVAPDAPDIGA